MMKPLRKAHPVMKIANTALVDLPAPMNISIWWNFGSMLGLCLIIQILTGIFLAMHYIPHLDMAFTSVAHISRDVNYGWLLRNIHANGASMFFACLYLHMARGIYYSSYLHIETWNIGVLMFVLLMATAFMGYVLPWGQMSFWAATVITNLLSAIPYFGKSLVEWVWGGFAVDSATLTRFYAFHFLLPFIITALSALHLLFLHQSGSNNPLGITSDANKVPFHWYFTTKDTLGFLILLLFLTLLALLAPNMLTDPENFIPANPLVTPTHIKPEWYFLWAYAILRSIPNKLGGVLAMFSALLIYFSLPFTHKSIRQGNQFYPLNQIVFWTFVTNTILLTWIGGCPVEPPYEFLGQCFTAFYFFYFILNPLILKLWDIIL